MRRTLFVGASVFLCATGALLAQPNGVEFLVNSTTATGQQHARVARRFGPQGPGFIVVWESNGAFVTDIVGASFNNLGIQEVGEFRVNSYLTGFQTYPVVAGEADGTFTVAWESSNQDGTAYGIYARRMSSTGSALGAELLVSSYTSGSQRHPAIALGGGATRVVFEGNGPGDTGGVFISSGAFATEALVNSTTAGDQRSASISSGISLLAGTPDFLVVWRGNGVDDADQGIYGHLYDSSGNNLGSDFRVNTTTAGGQTLPAVAANYFALGFVAVWETPVGGGSLKDVYAQRLNFDGAARGPEFRVNTYTSGNQDQPQVAVDDYGNFVIVWSSYQDGSFRSVHAQAFSKEGLPRGTEFRLNSFTSGHQRLPSVAATGQAEGDFVVVWQSYAQEGPGSGEGIYAIKFTVPPWLAGDVNGDGHVNASDVLYLINYLFASGPAPIGDGDVNNANGVNVSDVLYLINYLFAGGPAPI